MKKLLFSCVSALLVWGLFAAPGFAATDQTFGAGSLIIPMDAGAYQPGADGGIYVAYGLVYKLLARMAADGVTPDPIPIYWIIDDTKTSITAADLTISSTSVDPVAKEYTAAGESAIPAIAPYPAVGKSISYTGGPFVVDSPNAASAKAIWAAGFQNVNMHVAKVPFTGKVQRQLFGKPPKIALMNDSESRTGNATKILGDYLLAAGIVNDPTKCNALNAPVSGEGCVYDVLTPNEVGGINTLADRGGGSLNGRSLLFDYATDPPIARYNLLWVPHWTSNTNLNGQYVSFNPLVGTMPATAADGNDTIMAIRDFVSLGNGLFAECASIESIEGSPYGRFLTKFDIGKNGGSDNKLYIYYNKTALSQPYTQIGDFGTALNGFDPQGGHIHNWRPYQTGDLSFVSPRVPMAFNPSPSNLKSTFTQAKTGYEATVTVFTYDDPPAPAAGTSPAPDIHDYVDGDAAQDQWHYYVAGNMDGDPANGYVVYLGGHTYVDCSAAGGGAATGSDRKIKLSFKDNNADTHGTITMTIAFTGGSGSPLTVSGITSANLTTKTTIAGDLTLDLSSAAMSSKEITGMHLVNGNTSAALDITSITLDWTANTGDKVKDIKDEATGTDIETTASATYARNVAAALAEVSLAAAGGGGGFVSGCVPKGTTGAGIRYVLNTLFQLNGLANTQFVRSAPVVFQDFLYQGSFDYPAYSGHFRKFQVNADLGGAPAVKGLKLVTGFGTSGDAATLLTSDTIFTDAAPLKSVEAGELTGRNIYASTQPGLETGTVLTDNSLLQLFKFENAGLFQTRMSFIAPLSLSQTQTVVSKRYGMKYSTTLGWSKQSDVMGGVEHSAPVIIGPSALTSTTRPTVAYVGSLDGMIHAFRAGTDKATSAADPGEIVNAGKELWSFIPSSQLPKLQYFRDPNVISSYPAVDASLAYAEVPALSPASGYITVILATMGVGGNSLVALDATDPLAYSPAKPKVLWERSGVDVASCTGTPATPAGTPPCTVQMGNGTKVAIGSVKTPAGATEYRAYVTTALKDKKACQSATGVPLTDGSLCGGIQIYSFDLYTGAQKWRFERVYNSGLNDIPGSLSLVDMDQNGLHDFVSVGDMEGNMWLLPTVPDYDKDGIEDTVLKANSTFTDSPSASGSPGIITDINPLYAPSRDESACTGGDNPSTSVTHCYQLGQDQPIGISATVLTRGGKTYLAWATGGADWAGDTYFYSSYVLEITGVDVYNLLDQDNKVKGTNLVYKFVLDQGEKVFGALTYSEGYFYFATAFGKIEGTNPRDDVAVSDKGNIRGVSSSDKSTNWKASAGGKVRGSVFVAKGEVYATTLDGKIIDTGSGTFAKPSALKWFKVKSWREIFDLNTNK